MNLSELKQRIDVLTESVIEDGRNLDDIDVSIQLDDDDGKFSVCANDVSINYDNDGCVSGCVILGTVTSLRK